MISHARTHHNAESECAGLAEATRQAVAMLDAIFAPDDWICFHAVGQGGGKRWATLADGEIEHVIEWVWRANTRREGKCQPFFGANARRGHGQDRAEGTSHAPCYFGDWEGITVERVLQLIADAGMPPPTVVMLSGRGVHAYWRLHDPETHAGEWSHRQKWIAAAVGSDPVVSDWQRKMRLPGLANVKPAYAPDYPRSQLVSVDHSRRYSWRDLQPRVMPEPQRRPEPTREQLAEVARLPPGSMSELSRRFLEQGFTLPEGRRHTGFTVACDLAARGWKLETAAECIGTSMARWIGRGDKPLTRADVDDVPRQVLTAFSKPRTPIIDGAAAAPLRVEHLADDDAEVVPLGEYRERIAAAVSQAVRVRGVHLNTAGTGCGKTFATAKEVAKLPRSVTSAPTHALCEERAAELRSFGADAAAYPALDAMTCANYAEASRVQAAGLSPGRVLCHGCPFRTACEASGYLAAVKRADKARHKVVTHARLARSAKAVCRGAKAVVLEEEPTAAVRPSIAARGKEMLAVSTFTKQVAKLLRHDQQIEEVDLSAIGFTDPDYGLPTEGDTFAEFATWAPPADSQAAAGKETARDVVHGPRRRVRALQAKRLHRAAFFRHVADVARYVHLETRAAMRQGSGVYVIPMPAAIKPPKNIDGIVWPMMAEAAEPIPAEALRLAVAAASGGLQSLVVQVDANERYAKSHPDAKPLLRARAIGLWQTALPYRTASVIVNDGTNDAATVQAIVGREVNDITPPGRVPLQHPCVQYAVDVTLGTRPQTVANIVCGIARAHPDKSRLGAILLKAHRDKLLPVDDAEPAAGKRKQGRRRGPLLPRPIRQRIEWHTHYGSGLDRGSNDMHTRVDLAIVAGTFRPPPYEVRRRLIEMGLVQEAHAGDRWGVIERHARRPDGTPITYTGLGYASEAWRRAAESLSRAAARQGIGRARANTSRGVPVVAVTTEATGLPVLPAGDLPRSRPEAERVAEAVRLAGSTSAKSAITTTSRNGTSCPLPGATLAAVQARLPRVPRRTLMRWLATAVEVGAVIRTGHTTATRYTLPPPPEPPRQPEPAASSDPGERCPSCGSGEHRDTVSADGQVGRRACAECGAFVRFTVWHGKPVPLPEKPPPLSARVLDVAATVGA